MRAGEGGEGCHCTSIYFSVNVLQGFFPGCSVMHESLHFQSEDLWYLLPGSQEVDEWWRHSVWQIISFIFWKAMIKAPRVWGKWGPLPCQLCLRLKMVKLGIILVCHRIESSRLYLSKYYLHREENTSARPFSEVLLISNTKLMTLEIGFQRPTWMI